MPSYAIIIPCYNEENRLEISSFQDFFSLHPEVDFIFVNDGSTDKTKEVLKQLEKNYPQVKSIHLDYNKGKGEAVRIGTLQAISINYSYIGYFDADLSTSLEEFYDLFKYMKQQNLDIIFGSRIKKFDTQIERSGFRHFTGRILATIIDSKFKLGCYDTQCGAKIFRKEVLENIVQEPFFTRWFFDVEIFVRLKQRGTNYNSLEYPLTKWKNVKGSKLNLLSSPIVLKELFILLNKY